MPGWVFEPDINLVLICVYGLLALAAVYSWFCDRHL